MTEQRFAPPDQIVPKREVPGCTHENHIAAPGTPAYRICTDCGEECHRLLGGPITLILSPVEEKP